MIVVTCVLAISLVICVGGFLWFIERMRKDHMRPIVTGKQIGRAHV